MARPSAHPPPTCPITNKPPSNMTCSTALPYHNNPEVYFNQLKHLPDFSWLDSGRPASTQGRYDIFTACAISHAMIDHTHHFSCTDSHTSTLKAWLAKYSANNAAAPRDLPFTGGVLGYLGYHWQDEHFQLAQQVYSSDTPHAQLAAYDWALIVDHKKQQCQVFFLPDSQVAHQVMALLHTLPLVPIAPVTTLQAQAAREPFKCEPFIAATTEQEYLKALARIHDYILAGDCYQVNFSQRFSARYNGSLDTAYLTLRQATPSPFSAYLKHVSNPILSLSPERFLQINDRQVLTQPIKGSAPRGATPAHDEQLAKALQNSDKNRAENIMIVDLLRNDLSQGCQPFSVKVPSLCELHSFANVHHLISTVVGTLKEDTDAIALFAQCFPGGSITGAPKKRAMHIIAELEKHSRGIYCGSIAYFSNNGNADSSITIRTLQANNNQLHCWGGGGVVLDSVAQEEYQESLFKVHKLMRALAPLATVSKTITT